METFKRNLALVVGIDHYQNAIPQLKTATTDAAAIAQLFEREHHYEPVWVLLNEKATYHSLKDLLENRLPKLLQPNDRFIFYFAGHGIALDGDDGPKGYLIPQDAKLGDSKTYLPMAEVHDAITNLPCRHFLGIFDCCFAGTFRWSNTRDLLALSDSTEIFQERFDRFQKDPAWQVITSSADDETAYDVFALTNASDRGTNQNHSPFALALIEAFQGKADVFPSGQNGRPAGDGVITATELYLYLRDRVAQLTQNYSRPQTPGLWPLRNHRKGEFVFTVPGHILNLPQAPKLDAELNPYRGLNAFESEHQHLFFGRTDLIQELAEFVSRQNLTVVLGASGTGKSSLVKAGLLPQLQHNSLGQWQILPIIRPGTAPCQSFLQALQASPLALVFKAGNALTAQHLIEAIQQWSHAHPTQRLLIFIDQAEELFSLCRFPNERDRFLLMINAVIEQCTETLHVVLTLRSDFEPQFRETALAEQWSDSRFLIRPMNRNELRAAIEEPAALRVMYFEPPALVETLIDEVSEMPGALPLLSFTLSELYLKYLRNATRRSDRAITEADYQELGGIKQSLIQRAEEEYSALIQQDDTYDQTIRHVMLRMVAVSGTGNTRRQVLLSELEYPSTEGERVKSVLKRFEKARLIVSNTNADGHPYLEPAHDTLVEGWPRLLRWLESDIQEEKLQGRVWWRAFLNIGSSEQGPSSDEQEKLLLQRRLTPTANDWFREQKTQFLWHADARLPLLKQILQYEPTWFNTTETEFVQRSLSRKRFNVGLRWVLMLSLLAISVSVGFGVNALRVQADVARQQAEEDAQRALFRQLSAQAQAVQGENDNLLETSVLLAIEAIKVGKSLNLQSLGANQVIRTGLSLLPEPIYKETIFIDEDQDTFHSAIFSQDERYLIQISDEIKIVDLEDGKEFKRVRYGEKFVISPDGRHVAFLTQERELLVQELLTDKTIISFSAAGSIESFKFTPDSKSIMLSDGKGIQLWQIRDSVKKLVDVAFPNDFSSWDLESARLSFDGEYLIQEYDTSVQIWKVTDPEKTKIINVDRTGISPVVDSVAVSRYGYHAAVPNSGKIQVWDLRTGKLLTELGEEDIHLFGMTSIDLSPDGKFLAFGNRIGSVRVIELSTGQEELSFRHSQTWVKLLNFSPQGDFLIVGGGNTDEFSRVIEVSSGEEVARINRAVADGGFRFSQTEKHLLGFGGDFQNKPDELLLHAWKLASRTGLSPNIALPEALNFLPNLYPKINDISFDKYGHHVAITTQQNITKIYSLSDVHKGLEFEIEHDNNSSLLFSHSGDYFLFLQPEEASLWSVSDSQKLAVLDIEFYFHWRPKDNFAFSGDGETVFFLEDDKIRRWNTSSNQELSPVQSDGIFNQEANSRQKTISLDGKYIVTLPHHGSEEEDLYIYIYEIFEDGLQEINRIKVRQEDLRPSMHVTFSADNKYISVFGGDRAASAPVTWDGIIQVWSLADGERVFLRETEELVSNAQISHNGELIGTAVGNSTARVWDLESQEEVARIQLDRQLDGSGFEVKFSPDDKFLITTDDRMDFDTNAESFMRRKTSQAWLLESATLVSEACNRLTRNLTEAEWQQYFENRQDQETCSEQMFYNIHN